jgi:hypothetical protein
VQQLYAQRIANIAAVLGGTAAGPYLTVWRRGAEGRWQIIRNLVLEDFTAGARICRARLLPNPHVAM